MKAFECSRTGLLFPADYVENWGKKYGRGLGRTPVSEALINRYDRPRASKKDGTLAHPIHVCKAPVFPVEVSEAEFNKRKAILRHDDPMYRQRGPIMRERQAVHYKKGDKEQINLNTQPAIRSAT